MFPEAPLHSATQGLFVKEICIQMFHMHMCTHAAVFTYMHTTTVKEENKSAFLGLDKMLDSVRKQPIQSEN